MRSILFCVMLAAGATARAADTPPRLELGLGGLAFAQPDYRGSDRYGSRVLPIPYAAYRSERVQLTREGLRARLFALDRITASISAGGSLPGSDDNPERAGMPQLDPTGEVGPSLDFMAYERPDGSLKLKVRLPARAVFAADGFEFREAGWVLVPHLRLDYEARDGRWEWFTLASIGAIWATENYHEYFYGVAPEYATAGRPAYDARGGYSAARATISTTLRRARWRFGVFASGDWLAGAASGDSPLVRTDYGVTGGVFVTYRLYASGPGEPLEGEEP